MLRSETVGFDISSIERGVRFPAGQIAISQAAKGSKLKFSPHQKRLPPQPPPGYASRPCHQTATIFR